ncbi:uncharacterized protein LOC109810871 [Cajanus cajan]|uniref:uncharacterized protein LOC109810871 n=1 Tax=Cajanus cajan TaxID=3821 RepID=UPI00098DD1FA|nr:uncharacterized protein LOC109810871 [Cajanus cajan]
MTNVLACYQLLELNVISAQDLAPVGRSMRTYAVAWIDPDRKLSTRVDSHGGTNPAWNDKFVFRVDEDFLYDEESAITIDIYALHWFRDIHVGTAHVLPGDIFPQPSQPNRNANKPMGLRFMGLQVERPSGRPKGILNVGAAIIDSSKRSMPLYTHDPPTVGYSHDDHNQLRHQTKPEIRRTKSASSSMLGSEAIAPQYQAKAKKGKPSSQVTSSEISTKSKRKASSSMLSASFSKATPRKGKLGKKETKITSHDSPNNFNVDYHVKSTPNREFQNSSTLREFQNSPARKFQNSPIIPEFQNSPGEFQNSPIKRESHNSPAKREFQNSPMREFQNTPIKREFQNSPMREFQNSPAKREFQNSPMREFQNSPIKREFQNSPMREFQNSPTKREFQNTPVKREFQNSPMREFQNAPIKREFQDSPMREFQNSPTMTRTYNNNDNAYKGGVRATPLRTFVVTNAALEYGTPYRSNLGRRPMMTNSELGPSASEVAAIMARIPMEEENSEVEGWSFDESVEGSHPKVNRWKAELSPEYDDGERSNLSASSKKGKHSRKQADGGLFSCFSVICGVECSIVCGGGAGKKSRRRRVESVVDNESFL